METTITTAEATSKGVLWTGRILKGLLILFLLLDAGMKIFPNQDTIAQSAKVGWTVATLRPIGFVLLLCIILYAIPRTTFFGAILLTAYLGGATASCILAHLGMTCIFPIVFGVLIWVALILTHRPHRVFILSTLR